MAEEAAQERRLMLDGARGAASTSGEVRQIDSWIVGEWVGFKIGPQVLDWIELWGVGREVFQMSRAGGHALGNQFAQVRLETIPDQYDGGAQLALQVFEKVQHTRTVDVGIRMQAEVQRDAIAPGCDAHGGDGRDLAMRAGALAQDGRVSAQAPGAAHQRSHHQARFVDKDQRGAQAGSVFFTRGQSCSIQAWIRASSRSTARRVGFCGENPKPCNRRLTCAG